MLFLRFSSNITPRILFATAFLPLLCVVLVLFSAPELRQPKNSCEPPRHFLWRSIDRPLVSGGLQNAGSAPAPKWQPHCRAGRTVRRQRRRCPTYVLRDHRRRHCAALT